MTAPDDKPWTIAGCFTMIVFTIIGYLMSGWVLTVLWGWFITPVFTLPTLSLPCALGLSLIVNFLIHHPTNWKEIEQRGRAEVIKEVVLPFFRAGIALGLGWIILQFV